MIKSKQGQEKEAKENIRGEGKAWILGQRDQHDFLTGQVVEQGGALRLIMGGAHLFVMVVLKVVVRLGSQARRVQVGTKGHRLDPGPGRRGLGD